MLNKIETPYICPKVQHPGKHSDVVHHCHLTNYIDAVLERDCIGAFGFDRNGRPQLPAVCPGLPALDLIRRQFSIRATTNHVDPSIKTCSSKGADTDCKRCLLQFQVIRLSIYNAVKSWA